MKPTIRFEYPCPINDVIVSLDYNQAAVRIIRALDRFTYQPSNPVHNNEPASAKLFPRLLR
jgi:hypothetical protein